MVMVLLGDLSACAGGRGGAQRRGRLFPDARHVQVCCDPLVEGAGCLGGASHCVVVERAVWGGIGAAAGVVHCVVSCWVFSGFSGFSLVAGCDLV
eukprot:01845_1